MKTVSLTLVALLAITFYACKKERDPITIACNKRTNKVEEVKQLIAGKYEWVYTKVVVWGTTTTPQTPASTGSTHQYVFDNSGTVKYFENQKLVWDRMYEVDFRFRVYPADKDSSAFIVIKDKETLARKESFMAYLCNDSALFYNPYFLSDIDLLKNYKRHKQ